MSEQTKPSISFLKELRTEILEAVNIRNLILYGVTIVILSIVSIVLPYQVLVYSSIIAGIVIVLFLVASLVILRGFTKLDAIFISGIIFLVIALFPKEYLISSFPTLDILRDFKHLSRILSIALTALYVVTGIFQFVYARPHGAHMKHFSSFFSVCNTTISSELCACLHPIPLVDMLLAPLGVADLLTNRVKLGFVIMMVSLAFQTRSFYESYKNNERKISISK